MTLPPAATPPARFANVAGTLAASARRVRDTVLSLGTDEQALLLVLAGLIGAGVGVAVALFYRLIDLIQNLVLVGAMRAPIPPVLLLPAFVALGLLGARALVRWLARDSDAENIPDVMYRVSVKGGVIPLKPVLGKTAAAALLIGTGGSVGAEGPVVVLGAGAASKTGRFLRSSPHRLRTLAGCGAAAGLAAAFNAPIADVIFGLEKIAGTTGGGTFGPYVVASILAATVGRGIFGNHPVLVLPAKYGVGSPWELLLYAGLGLLTGGVAVLYTRIVWRTQEVFAGLRHGWVKILLAALAIGGLDLLFRQDLWGHGHQSVDLGIMTQRTALFLTGLALAKLLATAITLAAGGAGGVFTPALFIGAALGGASGMAILAISPAAGIAPGAVALVGMAGVVAGATHAPLTAIMMVFEMTGEYALIMPLMLTSVIAYTLARRLHPESIYTEWLTRHGIVLTQGADAAVLARVTVGECVNARPVTVPAAADLPGIRVVIQESRQTEFPVVDTDGGLVGMLDLEVVRQATAGDSLDVGLVRAVDLATSRVQPVTSEDSLLIAVHRLGGSDVDYLPVVDARTRTRLVGIVHRSDLTAAYERELALEGHAGVPSAAKGASPARK
jgi:CIC family chloride channel protein